MKNCNILSLNSPFTSPEMFVSSFCIRLPTDSEFILYIN